MIVAPSPPPNPPTLPVSRETAQPLWVDANRGGSHAVAVPSVDRTAQISSCPDGLPRPSQFQTITSRSPVSSPIATGPSRSSQLLFLQFGGSAHVISRKLPGPWGGSDLRSPRMHSAVMPPTAKSALPRVTTPGLPCHTPGPPSVYLLSGCPYIGKTVTAGGEENA